MAAKDRKSMLLVIRHSPYGSSLAKAALDVALAAAAFEQEVDLLFMGDGVLQLLPEQDSAELGRKNIGRQWASLPLYDINTVHVDAAAAARYNIELDKLTVKSRALDAKGIHQLMAGFDHLLGF
jgi:tRNA 2-thiouridine synthesizing protein C